MDNSVAIENSVDVNKSVLSEEPVLKEPPVLGEKIEVTKKSIVKDSIIFSLIFIVILMWCYTIYLWMLCCFNWSTNTYKYALSSVIASSIVTIIAIIIVIVLSRLRR
jgi:hypothetical protein